LENKIEKNHYHNYYQEGYNFPQTPTIFIYNLFVFAAVLLTKCIISYYEIG